MVVKNNDVTVLPDDLLSDEEKIRAFGSIEEWAIAYVDAIDNTLRYDLDFCGDVNMEDIEENLMLIEEGFFDIKKYKYLVNPFFQQVKESEYKYPIEIKHYDVLSTKITTLVGEESAKSDYIRVYNRSTGSANKRQQQLGELLTQLGEERFAVQVNKMQESKGAKPLFDVNNPKEAVVKASDGSEIKTPQDAIKHINLSAGDIMELNGTAALKWAKDETNYKFKFNKNYIKYLCSDIICWKIDKLVGKPTLEVIDPRRLSFSLPRDKDFIQESSRIREVSWVYATDVHAMYHEYLDDDDLKELNALKNGSSLVDSSISYNFVSGKNLLVRVASFEWQTTKKIGIVTRWNDAGRPIKDIVHEDYKIDKTTGETIEYIIVPEWWEGVRIGRSIYIKLRPIPGQFERIDHIGKSFSKYVGYRGYYPFLTRGKVYQELRNAIMYLLYVAFLRAKGKGMIVDMAQVPKSKGWTPEKWFYYMDFFGILPINSLERNDKNEKSSFNQWKEYDLSAANVIQGYINTIAFIDNAIDEVFGITPQREGQTQASETATGVQAAINKSVSVTEIFSIKNLAVSEMVCQKLVDIAQSCLEEGESYTFVAPDTGESLFTVAPGFSYADFSVRAVNSIEDRRKANVVQEVLKGAWAQKDTLDLLDLIGVIRSDSIVAMEVIAKEARIRNDENTKAAQEQQTEQQQMLIKQQQALQATIDRLKEMELNIKKYTVDKNSETDIKVAEITAAGRVTSFRPDVDADIDDNGIVDASELEKIKASNVKLMNDMAKHNDKLKVDVIKHKDKMALDSAKHVDKMILENKKLNKKPTNATK
jgi:hypothetical protein